VAVVGNYRLSATVSNVESAASQSGSSDVFERLVCGTRRILSNRTVFGESVLVGSVHSRALTNSSIVNSHGFLVVVVIVVLSVDNS
jgi:hypothetical protein